MLPSGGLIEISLSSSKKHGRAKRTSGKRRARPASRNRQRPARGIPTVAKIGRRRTPHDDDHRAC
jgi:hypothetical protein